MGWLPSSLRSPRLLALSNRSSAAAAQLKSRSIDEVERRLFSHLAYSLAFYMTRSTPSELGRHSKPARSFSDSSVVSALSFTNHWPRDSPQYWICLLYPLWKLCRTFQQSRYAVLLSVPDGFPFWDKHCLHSNWTVRSFSPTWRSLVTQRSYFPINLNACVI